VTEELQQYETLINKAVSETHVEFVGFLFQFLRWGLLRPLSAAFVTYMHKVERFDYAIFPHDLVQGVKTIIKLLPNIKHFYWCDFNHHKVGARTGPPEVIDLYIKYVSLIQV
jgi:hypothetical protein